MSLARQTLLFFSFFLFFWLRCFCYLRVSLLLRRRSSFSPPLNAVIPLSPSLTAPLMFGPTGAANDALLFSSAAAIARSSPSSPAPSSVLCEGRGGVGAAVIWLLPSQVLSPALSRRLSRRCLCRRYRALRSRWRPPAAATAPRNGGFQPPPAVREEHEHRLLKLFLFQSFCSFHLNAPVLCVCVYVSNTPPFRLCDFRVRASSRFDATPQQMAAVLGAAARKLKRSAAGEREERAAGEVAGM